GRFIEGYYIVGLLADQVLHKEGKGTVIHDPRLTWNTRDLVLAAGGTPSESKTGRACGRQRRRDADALYGGEMRAHECRRDIAQGCRPVVCRPSSRRSSITTIGSLGEISEASARARVVLPAPPRPAIMMFRSAAMAARSRSRTRSLIMFSSTSRSRSTSRTR